MKHTKRNYYLKLHHPRCVISTINETVLLSENTTILYCYVVAGVD